MKQPLLSDPSPSMATKEPAKTTTNPKFKNQNTEELIFEATPDRQEKEKEHKWFGHHIFGHHHHHGGHTDVYITTTPSYGISNNAYGVPQGYAVPGYMAPGYGTYMAPAYVAPVYNPPTTYQSNCCNKEHYNHHHH